MIKDIEPYSDTEFKWGINYNAIPDIVIDAAVMYGVGNSPVPPTLDDMLDRDPLWDNDVVLTWAMIQRHLRKHETNDKLLEKSRNNGK